MLGMRTPCSPILNTSYCFSLFIDPALNPDPETWYSWKTKGTSQIFSSAPALPHCQSSSPPNSPHRLSFSNTVVAPAALFYGNGFVPAAGFTPEGSNELLAGTLCWSGKMLLTHIIGEEQLEGLKPSCPKVCRHFVYSTVRHFALLRTWA